jgi:hypothetical protein
MGQFYSNHGGLMIYMFRPYDNEDCSSEGSQEAFEPPEQSDGIKLAKALGSL